jgi:PEP-CTERM motif
MHLVENNAYRFGMENMMLNLSNPRRSTPLLVGCVSLFAIGLCSADVLYFNDTPNNLMAAASRPDTASFEIESADDFVLTGTRLITNATFTGLFVPGTAGTPSVSQVVIEIYRVFPNDSNTVRIPNVPTRANSPSDVALDSRDSNAGELTFSTNVLNSTFTALNSVQPGGIHPSPNQHTGGNGPLTGSEVQFSIDFTSPFLLPANHYFFIPQVELSNGGQFYWLSASRPISGPNTTPFAPDLQSWTRDANLDPDWLRIGSDIVGTPQAGPTFNAAFSLSGTVPEPGSLALVGAGLLAAWRYRRKQAA